MLGYLRFEVKIETQFPQSQIFMYFFFFFFSVRPFIAVQEQQVGPIGWDKRLEAGPAGHSVIHTSLTPNIGNHGYAVVLGKMR